MEKNKIKLVELTETPWAQRWQALSEVLKSEFQTDFEFEIKPVTAQNLHEALDEVVKSDFNVCRVSDSLSSKALTFLAQTTSKALFSGVSALLIKEKNQWWPRPLLEDALTSCLAENFGQLDIGSSALVVGSDGAAKQVIAGISKLGYSTINVTDKSEKNCEELIKEMKKRFFEIKFKVIPFQEITTLPGVHSLVINTTALTLENDLLDELYFFNFLKSQGAVVDLTLVPSQTPLILEAKQWGARHLSGDFIAAACDILMVEKLTGKKLDGKKYLKSLRKNVDAAPFDAGPFLQRFRERGS